MFSPLCHVALYHESLHSSITVSLALPVLLLLFVFYLFVVSSLFILNSLPLSSVFHLQIITDVSSGFGEDQYKSTTFSTMIQTQLQNDTIAP